MKEIKRGMKNGIPIAEEEFGLPDGKPGEHRTVQIPYTRYLTEDVDYHINLEVKLKEDCVWAKAGHIVATEQFLLKKGTVIKNTPSTVSPIFNKADIFNVVREREGVLYFRRPNAVSYTHLTLPTNSRV